MIFYELISRIPSYSHNGFFNRLRADVLRKSGADIYPSARVYENVKVIRPANLRLGENSFINMNCLISAFEKISIGKNVYIGYNNLFLTETHDIENTDKLIYKSVTVKDNVWITSACVILPGTVIEEGAVIAAGSVVSGVVEKYSLYAGSPAVKIKNLK